MGIQASAKRCCNMRKMVLADQQTSDQTQTADIHGCGLTMSCSSRLTSDYASTDPQDSGLVAAVACYHRLTRTFLATCAISRLMSVPEAEAPTTTTRWPANGDGSRYECVCMTVPGNTSAPAPVGQGVTTSSHGTTRSETRFTHIAATQLSPAGNAAFSWSAMPLPSV